MHPFVHTIFVKWYETHVLGSLCAGQCDNYHDASTQSNLLSGTIYDIGTRLINVLNCEISINGGSLIQLEFQ